MRNRTSFSIKALTDGDKMFFAMQVGVYAKEKKPAEIEGFRPCTWTVDTNSGTVNLKFGDSRTLTIFDVVQTSEIRYGYDASGYSYRLADGTYQAAANANGFTVGGTGAAMSGSNNIYDIPGMVNPMGVTRLMINGGHLLIDGNEVSMQGVYIITPTSYWLDNQQVRHSFSDETPELIGRLIYGVGANNDRKFSPPGTPIYFSDATTGVPYGMDASISKNPLVLYPNPANDRIHMTINGKEKTASRYTISNVYGGTVLHKEIEQKAGGLNGPIDVDVGSLPPGMYFVSLQFADATVVTGRIVVTR